MEYLFEGILISLMFICVYGFIDLDRKINKLK